MQESKRHKNRGKLYVDTSRIRALAAAPGISISDGSLVFSVADEIEKMKKEIKTLKILAGINDDQTN